MPILKLSRRTISAVGPVRKPTVFYDTDLKGFGLIVRPSGSKSWILEYRPGAGGRAVAKRRLLIGNAEILKPEAARELAKDLLADVRKGKDPAAERHADRIAEPFSEIASRWMNEHIYPKRKIATAAFYRGILCSHILPKIGTKQAIKVTRQDISKLHGEISSKRVTAPTPGAKRTAKLVSKGGPVVANRALATIAAVYSWCEGMGIVPAGMNPARGIEQFREQSRETFLSHGEIERLGRALRAAETSGLVWEIDETKRTAKHAPAVTNRRVIYSPFAIAAIRLLLLTGCRLREVLNLEWSHVDLENGFLRLPD